MDDDRVSDRDGGFARAGSRGVVIGAGGLGHIGIQCLKAYTPTENDAPPPANGARRER